MTHETAQVAARRLSAHLLAKGYEQAGLHRYTAANGSTLFHRIRLKHPADGNKWIRPMHANGAGYVLGEPDFGGRLKPLYRLHELAAADPALPVWWVEGEQKADALAGLGQTATTAGSATSDDGCDFEPLRGRRVIVWPDNDDAGRQHGERVAAKLRALGCAVETVDIAALALPVRGDVVDWLAAHPNAAAADLLALPRLADAGTATAADWPDPAPLPAELPAVDAFDLALLPDVLRTWIADVAERMQCPPDFPAVAAMVALGSLLGRKVCIRPKRLDSWYEAPNLWGCIVGRPSVMKSPALNDALRPLRELEGEAAAAHAEALGDWQMHKATREIERKAASANAFAAAKKGGSFDPAALIDAGDDEAPAMRRYVVNDASVEALGEVLMHNPNGVLAYRDELIGLLRQLDKEGNEQARAFYLSGWTGKESHTSDRIGRGLNRRTEHVCLGLLGSIQPGVIGQYVREAVAQGGGDGLMARFSLLVWPDTSGEFRYIDRLPDLAARDAAFAVFRRFDDLTPDQVVAACDFGDVYALRFDPEAQEVFAEMLENFERRLRTEEANGTHPALIVHLTKYRKLIPVMALICHLADKPAGGPVSMGALRLAIRWADYLESHARRVYASVMRPDVDGALELLRRIRRGEISDGFRLRHVYRNGWTRLANTEQAKQAAELLCDHDYLRREQDRTAGRWTESYRVHPALLAEAAEYSRNATGGY